MRTTFEKLFEPGKIGTLEIKNRVVMSPMGTHLARGWAATDQLINYHAARARGGVGLVVVESTRLQPRAEDRLSIFDDRFIPGLSQLAEAIHRGGAKAAIQILPSRGRVDEVDPIVASDVPPMPGGLFPGGYRLAGKKPRVLSAEEIVKLVEECGEAVKRARQAGFDAAMIHGAHGMLLSEFFSPLSNKRTDRYGGDIGGRARFAVEIVQSAKEKAGTDFPIIFRLSGDERVEGGFSLEHAIPTCQILEEGGADAIDVDSGSYVYNPLWIIPPLGIPRSYNVPLAEAIKKAVHIPVIVAGRINTPELAEDILQQGKADFIGLARALLADPEFANKTREGRAQDICPCIACLNCLDRVPPHRVSLADTSCTVNPTLAREQELQIKPADRPKKVLVVGGGPAGMEAAIVAAQRGHHVMLCEKQDRLGGQLLVAAVPPHKGELALLTDYLVRQVEKSRVEVRLGTEVSARFIEETKPDVVVVATGASPVIPDIPGIEKARPVTAEDMLAGKVEVGRRVIVIGGELVGCETAEFLAEKGKQVTITRRGPAMATKLAPAVKREFMLDRLAKAGVTMLAGVKYDKIEDANLFVVTETGERRTIQADTIVLAAGAKPNTKLYEALRQKHLQIHLIGDCCEPSNIKKAIHDGYNVGLTL